EGVQASTCSGRKVSLPRTTISFNLDPSRIMTISASRLGGFMGLLEALLYIIGFVFLFAFLGPSMDEGLSDLEKLQFLVENKVLVQVWHVLIYVVFGIALVPLTIAIRDQFAPQHLAGAKVAPVFGFIWAGLVIASGMITNVGLNTVEGIMASDAAAALSTWKTLEAVQNGLGGGVEVVGGVWVLLISLAGLQQGVFSRWVHYLGIMVGVAGTLTVIPGLEDLGAVFGLSQIPWFIWIGLELLRKGK
ncbi:MAG: hypothetical protein AAFV07_10095, partial [Bacteroidota bacterium]